MAMAITITMRIAAWIFFLGHRVTHRGQDQDHTRAIVKWLLYQSHVAQICTGFEDTTKIRATSKGTCQGDLAADPPLLGWQSATMHQEPMEMPWDITMIARFLQTRGFANCTLHLLRSLHTSDSRQDGSLQTKLSHRGRIARTPATCALLPSLVAPGALCGVL